MDTRVAKTVTFSSLVLFIALQAAWPNNEGQHEAMSTHTSENDPVENLRKMTSNSPAEASREVNLSIERAGATKQLDAAVVIIESLAYNLEPISSNETFSQEEMIPAISVLKRYYGAKVLPLLYVQGISTRMQWMRERCALAVRTIGNEAEIKKMHSTFSLGSTTNPNAKEFDMLLTAKFLKVKMYDPAGERMEQLDRTIENLKKR